MAEELANQTPVRLDVLLSLTPSAVTSDQLVVPGMPEEQKASERVARSHSVGSIREMGNTEAERRILDMVAAGGEAALAPSPTRTITPSESPAQPKRKLETTVSTENAIGVMKKKEKPTDQLKSDPSKLSINEQMEVDPAEQLAATATPVEQESLKQTSTEYADAVAASTTSDISTVVVDQLKNLNAIEEICNELLNEKTPKETSPEKRKTLKKKVVKSGTAAAKEPSAADDKTAEKSPVKTVKKIVNKPKATESKEVSPVENKTENSIPLAAVNSSNNNLDKRSPESPVTESSITPLEDVQPRVTTERRKSKIFEVAEKFQGVGGANGEKQKKIVIPGVSVGNFKKEFERKASLTSSILSAAERKSLEKRASIDSGGQHSNNDSRKSSIGDNEPFVATATAAAPVVKPTEDKCMNSNKEPEEVLFAEQKSDSVSSFSLEEARRSMENSIALLNQAKTESSKEVDQLCSKTESVAVSDDSERLKKIKNAREIIGNAIPVGRLCMGNLFTIQKANVFIVFFFFA